MLTAKMKQVLEIIETSMNDQGIPPSFDEIRNTLGLKSKSGVHRLMSALEDRGYIRRLPGRARAIEVLKPSNFGQSKQDRLQRAREAMASVAAPRPGLRDIPLLGRIAAGVPVSAIQIEGQHITLPVSMIGSGEHFALEACGQSMVNAGILDGDTVILKRTSVASDGDIVVALIDKEEATLKRLHRRGDRIVLRAANELFADRVFDAHQVEVQGRLVSLIRRFT